jgi:hypothetical protein
MMEDKRPGSFKLLQLEDQIVDPSGLFYDFCNCLWSEDDLLCAVRTEK